MVLNAHTVIDLNEIFVRSGHNAGRTTFEFEYFCLFRVEKLSSRNRSRSFLSAHRLLARIKDLRWSERMGSEASLASA